MHHRGPALSGLAWLVLAGGLAAGAGTAPSATTAAPTFSHDVAPLLYEHCAPCHHEGGPGPFPLITYDDARRRARQIARVTTSRFMPPWLPEPGHAPIVGENRLTATQIAMLAAWSATDAPLGDPATVPTPPSYGTTWQLGAPDLVLTIPEPYLLPADGGDVFWNVVMPAAVTRTRWVRAMEILPGNKRVVHHANVLLDRSGMGRDRDQAFPGPGFPGMDIEIASNRFEPDSHFLFWKPGTPALVEPPDMPWKLEPDTDLILNLHLQPSGRPEPITPRIGLYFTDTPATRLPMLVQLEHDGALDIPPGARDFVVTDTLTLPVDVDLLGLYPHAHYLGHHFEGTVRLPDGTVRTLLRIRNWDLNWQGVYQFAAPIALPRGTVLTMRWSYDNSADNVRNPHTPPERVTTGNRSIDEMSHLWVQLLPRRPEDRLRLQDATMRARLRKYPGDFVGLANLGSALQTEGRLDEALPLLRKAVAERPDHAAARNNLATALRAAGQDDEAIAEFRETLRRQPTYTDAEYNLAQALIAKGDLDEAIGHLLHVLKAHPDDGQALADLGAAWAVAGRFDEATATLERAVAVTPTNAQAHFNLGLIAAQRGDARTAIAHFEAASRLDPANREYAQALAEARAVK